VVVVVVVGGGGCEGGGVNENSNLHIRKRKHGNGEGNVKKPQNHSHIADCHKRLKTKLTELDVTSVAAKELAEALVFQGVNLK